MTFARGQVVGNIAIVRQLLTLSFFFPRTPPVLVGRAGAGLKQLCHTATNIVELSADCIVREDLP
jgi:hypothetical protein